jgi:hypothetical protein
MTSSSVGDRRIGRSINYYVEIVYVLEAAMCLIIKDSSNTSLP